ncbi:MAG: dienelactone hydrolase family protein [Mucilaginibacter polytrichastri]|nr:dienelactone hydrolase family protein [Mucilaginibacter polytrichastri]
MKTKILPLVAFAVSLLAASCEKSDNTTLAKADLAVESAAEKIDKSAATKAFVSRTEGQGSANLKSPTTSIKRYATFIPRGYNANSSKLWPVVIYLHDAGAKGTNINSVKNLTINKVANSSSKDYQFLIISPQLEYTPKTWVTADLNKMLTELIADYNIDPKLIAVTGEGLGGNGAWTWAIERPTLFSSVAPVGGWSNPGSAGAIKNVPVWAFNGSADYQGTKSMVSAYRGAGGTLKYTEYKKSGTALSDEVYSKSGVLGWMYFDIFEKKMANGGAAAPAPTPSKPETPANNGQFVQRTEGQTAHNLDNTLGSIRQYLAYVPAGYNSQPTKKWPLVIYLHGQSEKGNDINKIFWSYFCWRTMDRHYPYLLITPQLQSSQGSWNPADLDKMLDEVVKKYNVDPNRIIINGYSLGGNGAWKWAQYNPNRFAGMVATSGWGTPSEGYKLVNLPIQAFHGTADKSVNVSGSVNMINAIKQAGGTRAKLTTYPGEGHLIFDKVFGHDDNVVNWMLAQRK